MGNNGHYLPNLRDRSEFTTRGMQFLTCETTQIASPIGSRSGFKASSGRVGRPDGAHVGFEWASPSPRESHGPTVAHGNPRRDLGGLAIWA